MLAVVIWLSAIVQAQGQSPYAGQETHAIKALGEDEIERYKAGDGMGLAKAAELNGHPGPKHVLELADRLELTAAQRATVQDAFDRMHAEAVRLGALLIEREQALDRLFAGGAADAKAVRAVVGEIARLQGELRSAHLVAHVTTRAALSVEQTEAYAQLRGYGTTAQHHHHR